MVRQCIRLRTIPNASGSVSGIFNSTIPFCLSTSPSDHGEFSLPLKYLDARVRCFDQALNGVAFGSVFWFDDVVVRCHEENNVIIEINYPVVL